MRLTALLGTVSTAATLLAAPVALAADPVRASATERTAANADDGLRAVEVRGVDYVARRPDADFARYDKVLIAPVEVAFSRSWNPRDYGRFGLQAEDVNRIRTGLGELARETFAKVLAEGGYRVVDVSGPDVLEVHPDIVDLYVNAPEAREAGRTRTYALSAGAMTLALELRDSVTGTVLARARDRKRDPETTWLEWSNEVANRAAAERALRAWATQLRTNLDAARAR